jgi:hypothetical protein
LFNADHHAQKQHQKVLADADAGHRDGDDVCSQDNRHKAEPGAERGVNADGSSTQIIDTAQ